MQGKLAEALELRYQCMAIERKTLGKNHPQWAASLNNTAAILKALSLRQTCTKSSAVFPEPASGLWAPTTKEGYPSLFSSAPPSCAQQQQQQHFGQSPT